MTEKKGKPQLNLGHLSTRRRSKGREFKAVQTLEQKKAEAIETKKLMDEWFEAGNIPFIGQHGPKEKPERAYTPASGKVSI